MRDRERFNQRDRRGRDHRPSHRIRGGNNQKFGRKGNNFHARRKMFNEKRRQFNLCIKESRINEDDAK